MPKLSAEVFCIVSWERLFESRRPCCMSSGIQAPPNASVVKGQAFHGRTDGQGEAVKYTKSGQPIENLWGGEDDPDISIATEGAKQQILEERKKKEQQKQERAAMQAEIEADPAYQQRQADLKRYSEMLSGLGANVENSWNDQSNFRIELDGIKPEKMAALVTAIQGVLR